MKKTDEQNALHFCSSHNRKDTYRPASETPDHPLWALNFAPPKTSPPPARKRTVINVERSLAWCKNNSPDNCSETEESKSFFPGQLKNIKENRGHSLTSTPLINMSATEWIKTFVKTKKKKGTEIPEDTDHYFNQWMIQSSNIYPLLWSSTKLS